MPAQAVLQRYWMPLGGERAWASRCGGGGRRGVRRKRVVKIIIIFTTIIIVIIIIIIIAIDNDHRDHHG